MRTLRVGPAGIMRIGCVLAIAAMSGFAAPPVEGFVVSAAQAEDKGGGEEATLRAVFERTSVARDESAVMTITIVSEGFNSRAGEPRFQAPDFDVLNQYSSRNQEVRYINGKFSARSVIRTTVFLRPRREGVITVSGIQAEVDGRTLKAQPLSIQVLAAGSGAGGSGRGPIPADEDEQEPYVDPGFGSGAGARPPKGYGGAGSGLRGTSKRPGNPGYFLRAEVDKQKVYKGEQLVVSYWLYARDQVTSVTATKYPVLNGFLREDIEIPIVGSQLRNEQVVLDGVLYARALLARYAAYPIQTGKVAVDSMAVDLMTTGMPTEEEDPAFGGGSPFGSLFRMMIPGARKGTARSEQVTIDVMALPAPPAGMGFTGAVGRFTVTAAADQSRMKAGEALAYTVRVEGRGSLAGITAPRLAWPEGLEPFETRSLTKSNKDGSGSRTFETVVIPRKPGTYKLPRVELAYFDPALREYRTASGAELEVQVEPGSASSIPSGVPASQMLSKEGDGEGTHSSAPTIRDAVSEGAFGSASSLTASVAGMGSRLSWILAFVAAGFAVITGGVLYRRLRQDLKLRREGERKARARRRLKESKSWSALRTSAAAAVAPEGHRTSRLGWSDVVAAYERLCGAIFDAIEGRFPGIGARALSRAELGDRLVGVHGVSRDAWVRAARVLEFAEAVRFASDPRNPSLSAVSEDDARRRLAEWVEEGMAFERLL